MRSGTVARGTAPDALRLGHIETKVYRSLALKSDRSAIATPRSYATPSGPSTVAIKSTFRDQTALSSSTVGLPRCKQGFQILILTVHATGEQALDSFQYHVGRRVLLLAPIASA